MCMLMIIIGNNIAFALLKGCAIDFDILRGFSAINKFIILV